MRPQRVERYISLTLQKRQLEQQIEEIQKELHNLEDYVLDDFIEADLLKYTNPLATAYVQEEPYVTAKPTDQLAIAALRKHRLNDLVETRINQTALRSYLKRSLEEQKNLPTDLSLALKPASTFQVRVRATNSQK